MSTVSLGLALQTKEKAGRWTVQVDQLTSFLNDLAQGPRYTTLAFILEQLFYVTDTINYGAIVSARRLCLLITSRASTRLKLSCPAWDRA
jgi:hypothetical protein